MSEKLRQSAFPMTERIVPGLAGLLAGKYRRVEKVYQLTNADHSLVTYRLDPEEQYRAFVEIEKESWELLAIYHSHAHSPAYPSATDLELAFYPEALSLILSLAGREHPTLLAFRIVEGAIEKVEVRVEGGDHLVK